MRWIQKGGNNPTSTGSHSVGRNTHPITGSAKKFKLATGRGVFVLSTEELNTLGVSKSERRLVKKFLPAKGLAAGRPVKWDGKLNIIYSTGDTVGRDSEIPNLALFLRPCRPLMDARRETANGKRKWFQLHWPRVQSLFESPGIVAVRMAKQPVFAWTDGGIYFDLSVNLIIPKNADHGKLLFLYLQTEFVKLWLKHRGKMKGGVYQVDGKPLRSIPVPDFSRFRGKQDVESVSKFAADWFGVESEFGVDAA